MTWLLRVIAVLGFLGCAPAFAQTNCPGTPAVGTSNTTCANTAFVTRSVSASQSPLIGIANAANLIATFQKTGVQQWNFSYVLQDIGGGGTGVNNLKLCSALPCNIPTLFSDDGMVTVGPLVSTWPNIDGNIDNTTGPGIRIAGDIGFSDYRTWGDLPLLITATANNGSGLIRCTVASTLALSSGQVIEVGGASLGASGLVTITKIDSTHFDIQGSTFSSAGSGWYGTGANSIAIAWDEPGAIPVERRFYTAQALNVDLTGGAFAIGHPDSELTAIGNPGSWGIFAYGSACASNCTYFNKIEFGVRSGSGTVGDVLVLGASQSYFVSDVNIGNGGPNEPLTLHLATNLNLIEYNNGGIVQIWGVNDAFNASEPVNIDGNALNLNSQSQAGIYLGGTLSLKVATWADNQTCTAGQISVDASFIYACTATNTVKRASLSTF